MEPTPEADLDSPMSRYLRVAFPPPNGSHARRRRSIRQVPRACLRNIVTSQTFTGNGVFAMDGESLRACGVGRRNDQSRPMDNSETKPTIAITINATEMLTVIPTQLVSWEE